MNIIELANKHAGVMHTDDTKRNTCFDYWEFNTEQLEAFAKAIAEQYLADIRALRELLERAQIGLEWYQNAHPEYASGEDDELHEEIDAILKD